jgi:UDP-glucose 4-epimerase
MRIFKDKTVVITGGTGSLGKILTRRLLARKNDSPAKIIIFSRDEAKQHFMRIELPAKLGVTDRIIHEELERQLEFRIGDIRNYHSVCSVLQQADIVINAAALKQVPTCEYYPYEAVQTNIAGAENIVRAIRENKLPVETVIGVSTDKACLPINVMGMTKAIQERLFINANISLPSTRFICVRYGNVLASRGSVIPLFHKQIKKGGPVTITTPEMTRFLLSLNRAADTIITALNEAKPGEIYVPIIPAARITNIARALIGNRKIEMVFTGIRPGEKTHESLVSLEESGHTLQRGDYYVIKSLLPEISAGEEVQEALQHAYSSRDCVISRNETMALLARHRLRIEDEPDQVGEFLR